MVGIVCSECEFSIGKALIFADITNEIRTEAKTASHSTRLHGLRDLPVEVGLIGGKERKKVMVCMEVICSGTVGFSKNLWPIVRCERVSNFVTLSGARGGVFPKRTRIVWG